MYMKNLPEIVIGENDITLQDMADLNQLLKYLNPEAVQIDFERVKDVMSSGTILSLRDALKDKKLIGMGTLLSIRKLFVFCGHIEDVVVSEEYQKKGLGRKIMGDLMKKSQQLGMKFVDLTSSPERESANQLYQSMGFNKRDTNVYRLYSKQS